MFAAIDGGTVIVLAVLFVIPIALIAFAGAGPALRQLGQDRFAIDHQEPAETTPKVSAEVGLREEVRQHVIASNERRVRRGETPLEVEAEVDRKLVELEELR